jgi:Spy/CpxP family protein refolding chaperone
VLVALVGLTLVAAGGREEGREGKRDEPAPGKVAVQRVPGMARPEIAEEIDVIRACGEMFDLTPDQKAAFDQIAQERTGERRKLLSDLNDKYAEKVKEKLAAEQKPIFEKIWAALNTYRASVRTAADELRAAVGEDVLRNAAGGRGEANPELLMRSVGLTAEQQGKVREAMEARDKTMAEARKSVQQPADRNDRAAVEKYRQDMKATEDKATADLKDAVNNLLTPEQRQQLEKIQTAIKTYSEKVKQAQDTYLQTLRQEFGGSEPRKEDRAGGGTR